MHIPKFADWKKSKKINVNENKTINESSFIEYCKAYKVNATQADADELGDDVSREHFKEYFNIPADADEDPSYKRDSNFDDKKLGAIKINEVESTDKDSKSLLKRTKNLFGREYGTGKKYGDETLGGKLLNDIDSFLQQNNDESRISESTSDFEILITSATKTIVEDSFENGEIGGEKFIDISYAKDRYDSFEDFCKRLDFSSDVEKWNLLDDKYISYSQLEDDDNIVAGDLEIDKWKKGEMRLWNAVYEFTMKFIDKNDADGETMEKILGIKQN